MRDRCSEVRTLLAALALVVAACGPPAAGTRTGGSAGTDVSFEPPAETSSVSAVVRIHVASSSLAPGDLNLFQGELSTYYLARIKRGDLPDALIARQVPSLEWRSDAELLVAPLHPLMLGEYSLSARTGLVTQFQVVSAPPLLKRVWPPASLSVGLGRAVYCGDGAQPLSLDPWLFEPGGISVTPDRGADQTGLLASACLHFDADFALSVGQVLVPPPVSGVWALDPAPFSGAPSDPAPSLACSGEQLAFGPGCAGVADDRVTVQTPVAALLWALQSANSELLVATPPNASFVWRGFSPGSTERVWGSVYDGSGSAQPIDHELALGAARERPVLSELLANPLGPEPQSEWIEILNDGTLDIDLAHFAVRDSGASRPLPAAVLAPGQYALLVREDFSPNPLDVPPAPGTRLIRVPQLGTAGLSNGGENVALLDAEAAVVSLLPALPTKAGQSLARRHAWSADDDPDSFLIGTPTPGAPND